MSDDDDRSRDDTPDETRDEAPTDESDDRDERIASLLEVPPLDEVTRRGLVTRALAGGDERRRPRSRRLLVPAAAALVVLVLLSVGALVLVTRGDDNGGTAARSTPAEPQAPKDSGPAGEAAEPSPAGISDLGDLGELSETTDLRRRVAEALRQAAPIERAAAPACLDRALTGSPAPSAYGTGSHGGRPVLVLVLPSRGDRMTVVLLDQETCRAVSVVNLS
jgi:hypothetical protein